MKTNKILYWVFTVLFAGFMAFSSIGGVEPSAQAIEVLHKQLGYPIYFIQFISVAKIIGAIVLLIPGFHKVKEWVYAGMCFDLVAAFYSVNASAGKFEPSSMFILVILLVGAASYYFWKKLS